MDVNNNNIDPAKLSQGNTGQTKNENNVEKGIEEKNMLILNNTLDSIQLGVITLMGMKFAQPTEKGDLASKLLQGNIGKKSENTSKKEVKKNVLVSNKTLAPNPLGVNEKNEKKKKKKKNKFLFRKQYLMILTQKSKIS